MLVDGLPHLVGVEFRQEHRAAPVEQCVERAPLRGAVHQRRDDDPEIPLGRLRGGLGELPFVLDPLARLEVDKTAEHAQHVFLTPYDTLRHPGRAARVQDVDVVVGTIGEIACR